MDGDLHLSEMIEIINMGVGKLLFKDVKKMNLKLLEARTFKNGIHFVYHFQSAAGKRRGAFRVACGRCQLYENISWLRGISGIQRCERQQYDLRP